MNEKLLFVALAVLIVPSSSAATGSHGVESKMFSTRWHNFNNCEIPITNYGEFGYMYGFWPTGSGEPYIFGAGIWIGAMKNGDAVVSCGYNPFGHGNDWMPGPPEHNYDHSVDPFSHPEDRIYLSNDPTDLEEWPLRDSVGLPIIFSEQDGWGEYNDLWEENHQWEPGTYPLGLWVRQHSLCWKVPSTLEDMLFILYQIENVSLGTIEEMYVGIAADMDVGWADDDLVGCVIEKGLGYTYTPTQEPGWSSPPPYYVGVAFVRGPRADDTVYVADGPWNPDYPEASIDTIYPGECLPLTSFTRCTGPGCINEEEKYLMLAGYNVSNHERDPWQGVRDVVPDDKRMILGCGPFDLIPGEIDTLVIALMFSNGNTGGYDHLLRQSDTARTLYESNWIPSEVLEEHPSGLLLQSPFPMETSPNPFTAQTTIRYGLPDYTRVNLKVYNLLGQEIRLLVDELQAPGIHTIIWDGRDHLGRKVSSGSYFLRLAIWSVHTDLGVEEAEGNSATRRVCVVK